MGERQPATEQPALEIKGILAEIETFARQGTLPEWSLPHTLEDRSAIHALLTTCSNWTLGDFEELTASYYPSCPPQNLFFAIALFVYETLASAYPDDPELGRMAQWAQDLGRALSARVITGQGTDPQPRDVPREISYLGARLMTVFDFRSDEPSLYRELAATQVWMMARIAASCAGVPYPASTRPEVRRFCAEAAQMAVHMPSSRATREHWWYIGFVLALKYLALQRLYRLPLADPQFGPSAIDWLLGRTNDPAGYIAGHLRTAARETAEESRTFIRQMTEEWVTAQPDKWTLSPTREKLINWALRVQYDNRGAEASDSGTHMLRHALLINPAQERSRNPLADIREAVAQSYTELLQGDGEMPKLQRKRVSLTHPLTEVKDHGDDEWTPPDESALLMPSDSGATKGSFDLLGMRLDVVRACAEVGLTTAQTKLYIAQGFWPGKRQTQAAYAGIPEDDLEAAEKRIARRRDRLAELLASYESQWQRGPETSALREWRTQNWPFCLRKEYRPAAEGHSQPGANGNRRRKAGHCTLCGEQLIEHRCPRELEFDHGYVGRGRSPRWDERHG